MPEYSRKKKERIAFLISKRLTEGLTADEMRELELYYQEEPALIQLAHRLESKKYMLRMIRHRRRAGKGKDIEKLLADIHEVPVLQKRKPAVIRWIGASIAAAAIVIFAIIKIGAPWHSQSGVAQTSPGKAPLTISTGSTWAVLTLADGKKIRVDKMHKGQALAMGVCTVTRGDSNRIIYQAVPNASKETNVEAINGYITLETSQGGQYNITLPDGSRVWLNDSSTLRFPVAFSGNSRKVDVTGEAYFEVTHNSRQPFIAHVPMMNQDVLVLGTSFNIYAYAEDPNVVITLIKGRVRVIQDKRSQDLLPDEQLTTGRKGSQYKKKVNTNIVLAWKKGEFNFTGDSLSHALRVVARSYGVGLELPHTLIEHTYNSSISRVQPLSAVLSALSTKEQQLKYIPERKMIVVAP